MIRQGFLPERNLSKSHESSIVISKNGLTTPWSCEKCCSIKNKRESGRVIMMRNDPLLKMCHLEVFSPFLLLRSNSLNFGGCVGGPSRLRIYLGDACSFQLGKLHVGRFWTCADISWIGYFTSRRNARWFCCPQLQRLSLSLLVPFGESGVTSSGYVFLKWNSMVTVKGARVFIYARI